MKAVVVIPTFNEKENIQRLLKLLKEVFKKVKGWDFRILVVDDNSPDGTARAVRQCARKYKNIHLLLRKKKVGLGAAYLAGMKEAFEGLEADVVVVMDADLSHKPEYLPEFLKKILGGADFVVGSRRIPGGAIPQEWPVHRKFLSIVGNTLVTIFLGSRVLTDWTSGYRAIKKDVYKRVRQMIIEDKAEFRGYTFNISFAYHTIIEGFKVVEIPIKFPDRKSGKSKLGLEYLFHTPLFLFKTRLKELSKAILKP